MTSRSVRRSRVAAAALSALAIACTEDRSLIGPPPVRTGATSSASVQILLTAPATFSLRTPSSNTDVMGWTPTAIRIGAGQPARVTVSGTLEFQANPVRVRDFGPPPTIPTSIGPAGASFPWGGSEEVLVRIRRPDGSLFPVDLSPQWDPGAPSTQGIVQGPGELEVARPIGIAGGASCQSYPGTHGCPNGTDYEQADDYLVSGEQTLTAEPLDTARIVATPLRVQTAGDTATFAISLSWTDDWFVPPLQPWLWVPLSGAPPRDAFCGSERTCRFPVSEPGHMEVGVSAARGVVNFRVRGPAVPIGPLEPPPDSMPADTALALAIEPSRREVLPVSYEDAPRFNAVTQTGLLGAERATRRDTLTVIVRVSWLPSHRPAAGAQVTLQASPLSASGGHGAPGHSARPTGTFFGADADVTDPNGGTRGTGTLTLAADGSGSVVYRTSGVAGLEYLDVVARAQGSQRSRRDSVAVKFPGLRMLTRDGTHHYFKDQSDAHGNNNNWLQPAFSDSIEQVFATYFDSVATANRFLSGETRFTVTDAGLEWGGLLDFQSNWHDPHMRHRSGSDMDVRFYSMNATRREDFRSFCRLHQIRCEVHPNSAEVAARLRMDPADPDKNPTDYHFHLRPQE